MGYRCDNVSTPEALIWPFLGRIVIWVFHDSSESTGSGTNSLLIHQRSIREYPAVKQQTVLVTHLFVIKPPVVTFDRLREGGLFISELRAIGMDTFDLDLLAAEDQLEDEDIENRVVLGVLDGTSAPNEWVGSVREGFVLVLAIEGDLNELAADFARTIKDMGGHLVHFRGFLIITPPGIHVDTDRL